MMLITGLTICCLILTVQPQNSVARNQFFPQYRNPDSIYFPDRSSIVPLSIPQSVQPNNEVLQQIFGTPPRNNDGVEIERSNEISVTTTVQQVAGRQSTPEVSSNRPSRVVPNGQLAQQLNLNRQIQQAAVVSPLPQQPTSPNSAGYNSLLYSVTNFGINLLKNVNGQQSGNLVMSPYSVTTLLALLQQGASGVTQEQISTALQMNPATSAAAYSEISNDYKNRNTRNILRTANNVFVGDTFVINQDFKKVAQRNFNSDITPISFGRPDQAAGLINSWVASKTNNKIERLISPDSLDSTTQLVLVNAVYFKGLWEIPFRVEATLPREFYLGNGQKKTIPFMRMRRPLNSGIDSATNARVVILPFERNQYSLMVILPSTLEGITGTLRSLTDARLLSYLSFSRTDIDLEIPKFTVRADTDLAQVLRNMGLTKMFGSNAELDGLGTYRAFSPQISSALHSAVLSIDEQGGSAAASTSFAAVALSYDDPSIFFKVNRPFIAVLWDTTTSLPLFMAKIEDPLL